MLPSCRWRTISSSSRKRRARARPAASALRSRSGTLWPCAQAEHPVCTSLKTCSGSLCGALLCSLLLIMCLRPLDPMPLFAPLRWSWAICTDTCAICRNNLYEPSIEYQANPTGAILVPIHKLRVVAHRNRTTQVALPLAVQATLTIRASALLGAPAAMCSIWTASSAGSRRDPPAPCATARCAALVLHQSLPAGSSMSHAALFAVPVQWEFSKIERIVGGSATAE